MRPPSHCTAAWLASNFGQRDCEAAGGLRDVQTWSARYCGWKNHKQVRKTHRHRTRRIQAKPRIRFPCVRGFSSTTISRGSIAALSRSRIALSKVRLDGSWYMDVERLNLLKNDQSGNCNGLELSERWEKHHFFPSKRNKEQTWHVLVGRRNFHLMLVATRNLVELVHSRHRLGGIGDTPAVQGNISFNAGWERRFLVEQKVNVCFLLSSGRLVHVIFVQGAFAGVPRLGCRQNGLIWRTELESQDQSARSRIDSIETSRHCGWEPAKLHPPECTGTIITKNYWK